MNLFISVILFIYTFSLCTSLAGMEFFGWLMGVTTLFVLLIRNDFKVIKEFPAAKYLLLFLGAVILGVLINSPSATDQFFAIGRARWVLYSFLLFATFRVLGVHYIEKHIMYFFALAGAVACYAIAQRYTGIDFVRSTSLLVSGSYWRSRGLFGHHLTFAYSYGMITVMVFGYLITLKSSVKMKVYLSTVCLLLIAAIFTSYSRAASASLLLSFGLMIFLEKRNYVKYYVATSVTMLTLLFVFIDGFWGRLLSTFNIRDGRFDIWRAQIEMIKDYPVLGIGYGEPQRYISQYYEEMGVNGFIGHAHSNYLEFLAGTGLVGFVFYILIILTFLILSFKLYSKIPKEHSFYRAFVLGSVGSQIFLHIGGLTESNFKDFEVSHMYWTIVSITSVIAIKYNIPSEVLPVNFLSKFSGKKVKEI